MPRSSPPKHRHDGTSPLPLGMDWSPPPRKWEGRNTIWPHDFRTGWSYCVMVPSWMVETGSGASNDTILNPIIFYRVQVGIQSQEGFSSSRDIFHRFSDFLKLYSTLNKAFPKKEIPSAPPKHALLRINSSRMLLEERRRALEEWMGKLLSDIDLSRSAPVATFLELEAAVRSSFEEFNALTLEASTLGDALSNLPRRSSSSASNSQSIVSDVSNGFAFNKFDAGDISNGIMNQPKDILCSILPQRKESNGSGGVSSYRNSLQKTIFLRETVDSTAIQDHDKLSFHSRRLSADSIGSDASSIHGSELSTSGGTSLIGDGSIDHPGGVVFPGTMEASSNTERQLANDAQILFPIDQRHKLNRVLLTMQRRLATARIDMDDIIARLNQEMTVKEYLATKVKDLEAELEVTKQRNKENLQQAILLERERFTQTQWDMDELRRKYLELESKLKVEQSEKTRVDSENATASDEKEVLLEELSSKQEKIVNLERHLEQVEMRSKADIKVLVKEVKFLRNSQEELKKMLNQSANEKSDLERVLLSKKQRLALANSTRKKLLRECDILCQQLQECSANFLSAEEDHFIVNPASLSDALGLLETSDNRISLLLAEAQLLAQEDEKIHSNPAKMELAGSSGDALAISDYDPLKGDEDLRKMLIRLLIDNGKLRKQLNSVFRCALKVNLEPKKDEEDEAPSQKTILDRFLRK